MTIQFAAGTLRTERLRPSSGRLVLLVAAVLAALATFEATNPAESAQALIRMESPLVVLLRFMAIVKAAMALAATGAILWRLKLPVTPLRLTVLAGSVAIMVAGPGLIWGLVHVGLGALLLHAGLATCLVTLWRDPELAAHLSALVAARQARLAGAR